MAATSIIGFNVSKSYSSNVRYVSKGVSQDSAFGPLLLTNYIYVPRKDVTDVYFYPSIDYTHIIYCCTSTISEATDQLPLMLP